MHPEERGAAPAEDPTEPLAVEGGQPAPEQPSTAAGRGDRRRGGRRAGTVAVLSGTTTLLLMTGVVAMAATATGPFAQDGEGTVSTASVAPVRARPPRPAAVPPPPPETATVAESVTAELPPPPPEPEPAPPVPPPPPATYVVAPGDTLAVVAERCGTPWKRIFDRNERIEDPNVLHAGWELVCEVAEDVPARPLPEKPTPSPTPESPPETAQTPETAEEDAPATPAAPAAPAVPDGSVWDKLAQCESGGRWNLNTGNGYYGGVQFSAQTWKSLGAPGLPHEHSREVQIHYAEILQAKAGWGQWPSCSRKLGLR